MQGVPRVRVLGAPRVRVLGAPRVCLCLARGAGSAKDRTTTALGEDALQQRTNGVISTRTK